MAIGDMLEDSRLLEDLPFASGLALDPDAREILRVSVVAKLQELGCRTAIDIVNLGCTGAVSLGGMTPGDVRTLRDNMAGSGVALPCYAPSNRWCLVHNTYGCALPTVANVAAIACSRALTPQELVHAKLIEKTQHIDGKGGSRILEAIDTLAGKRVDPRDLAVEDDDEADADADADAEGSDAADALPRTSQSVYVQAPAWKCDEHTEFVVGCRFCVAQAVVEGPLEPFLLLMPAFEGNAGNPEESIQIMPADFEDKLKTMDENHIEACALFVKVATWRRRLARDGVK